MSSDLPPHSTTLGDLLRAAGYIDDETLSEAKCLATVLNVPLLRVLSMGQLIPDDVLQAATELESGLRSGVITQSDVELILHSLSVPPPPVPVPVEPVVAISPSGAGTPPQAVEEADRDLPFNKLSVPPPTVWDFLALAEVAERPDDMANFLTDDDTLRLVDVVSSKYDLTSEEANLALTCYQQVNLGKLNIEDAVYAFNYCAEQLKRSVQPIDAAEQLGFRSGLWTIYDVLVGQ